MECKRSFSRDQLNSHLHPSPPPKAKDLPPGDPPGSHTRSKRAELSLDASKFQLDTSVDDAILSAQSALTPSTGASSSGAFTPVGGPGRPRSLTQVSPAHPSSPLSHHSIQRTRSNTVANPPKSTPPGGAPEREKRKRSRVTPEQLTHLERIFALDRSPTAAKRKEISEMLGMQERQTQIWFQNRRAKAKTLEGKGKLGFRGSPTSGGDSPPDTPPDYTIGLDVDLNTLIHEDEPVLFIPCSDLSIGSWRRISSTLGQHDLVAYMSSTKQCLTWFIHSNGYGFKMEIPFDIITNANFSTASPTQGLASIYLSRPPLFYLEALASPTGGLGNVKTWKKCADWTEGQQASKVFRHDIVGAPIPLVSVLRNLPGSERFTGLPTNTPLGPTPYHPTNIMPPMHIPQPPMAGLDPPPSLSLSAGPPPHLMPGRKRSFSGPPSMSQSPHDMSDFGMLAGPSGEPAAASPSSFSAAFPSRSASVSFDYPGSLFRSFHPVLPTTGSSHHAHPSLPDYSTVPISHAAAPRSYSAASTGTRFSFDSQAPPPESFPPAAEGSTNPFDSSLSSSSPLLTSGFNPASLHQDVHTAPAESLGQDMEVSHYSDDGPPQQHHPPSNDPPFEATLGMTSPPPPPPPPPPP